MEERGQPRPGVSPRALAWLLVGAVVSACAAWAGYEVSLRAGVSATALDNERRLLLFERTLEANIERFRYLPSTISQSREVREVLSAPLEEQRRLEANSFLSNLNSTAAADELFILDMRGEAIAASNWWSRQSIVGSQLEVRPYFEEALRTGSAKYYAVGLTTHVPGYFLAERIDGPGGPLGVAVAKINMGEIEAIWWRSGELIAIVDVNDIVILSTRPDWRYRALRTPPEQMVERIGEDLRYGERQIGLTGVVADLAPWRGASRAHIESTDPEVDGDFLVLQLRMPLHGWTLLSFAALEPLFATARVGAVATGMGTAGLLLGTALFIQRRRLIAARLGEHERLEERVNMRTIELRAANKRLEEEILEREAAERESRSAQEKLVQAAKLASMGQALAGVAHEISQPLAALNAQIASAKALARNKDTDKITTVLDTMGSVLSRLSALTGHLRTFARKETNISIISDVVQIVHNALELSDHKLRSYDIDVRFDPPAAPLYVLGNPIHLEQVFINLISNAADAMEEEDERVLGVAIHNPGGEVHLVFSDTGGGIPPEVMSTLFDPFFTTKAPGKGLGLGLSISYGLIKDMGGTISAESRIGEGTVFTVSLPLTEQRQIADRSLAGE